MLRSKCFAFGFILIIVLCAAHVNAQLPKPQAPLEDKESGRFSWQFLNPTELQFTCSSTSDAEEEELAKSLEMGEPHERLAAARELWDGRSRRQATNVLKYLTARPPGGEGFRKLQRDVEASLRPEAILRKLKDGDYLWGTWLAFLHPHEQLVPTLLEALEDKPGLAVGKRKSEMLPETMLALGNSGDTRALAPLLKLLKSKKYQIAGDAANALGYFGNADTEPMLIEALAWDNVWRQLHASKALGKFGSVKALPALEAVAKDDRYTGGLNVKGSAETAIERIRKRLKR